MKADNDARDEWFGGRGIEQVASQPQAEQQHPFGAPRASAPDDRVPIEPALMRDQLCDVRDPLPPPPAVLGAVGAEE